MQNLQRYQQIRNVTLIGVAANLSLAALKLIIGIVGNSKALVADGLHSLSDLISDGIVLIAAKYSAQQADAEHPYGHARFETMATAAIGVSLLLVATSMVIEVGYTLVYADTLPLPHPTTLLIALLSITVKEILYQYTAHTARRVQSVMLHANAWHHRTDAISSVLVLIGIAGTLLGIVWLDALAAVLVSGMIAHIGWQLLKPSLDELVDTGADRQTLIALQDTIMQVEGVQGVHELRTRYMGKQLLLDVHVRVAPEVTVSEGHYISHAVRVILLKDFKHLVDVLVHVDAENDTYRAQNLALPNRAELLARLTKCWQPLPAAQAIERINLHYLYGNVRVDIYLPMKIGQDIQDTQVISQRFMELVAQEPYIEAVRVYFYNNPP